MEKDHNIVKNCILEKCKSFQRYNKFNYRLVTRPDMFVLELSTKQKYVYIRIKVILGGVKADDKIMSLPTFYVYLLNKVKKL